MTRASLTPQTVPDDAYNATSWDGSLEVPTKNAIRDKIETMGGAGDVVGPASATDNAIARFDTTTGKLIQDSAITVGNVPLVTDSPVNIGVSASSPGGTFINLPSGTTVATAPIATTTDTQTLTNKTLTAPAIGAATATSINKVAITAPATSATLTIANGKTLTTNNSITFAGTDATTMTFPSATDTVAGLAATQTITGAWSYNDGKLILKGATSGTTVLKSGATAGSSVITLPVATDTLVGKDTTDTMTNKTLTSPVLNTGVSGTAFLDEDNMASNSATKLASQQSIKAYVDAAVAATKAALFPVGAIYTATVSTNPGTLLGFGTWAAFGAGRVPVGFDSGQAEFDTDEETGGAKTVTLTTAEMPSHTHVQDSHNHTQNAHAHGFLGVNGASMGNGSSYPGLSDNTNRNPSTQNATATNIATTATNQNTGGGGAHANLQPYIVVRMWKRTA